MVEKLNDLARKCALFIDNAATASQVDFDDVTREAIQLNVFAPMLVEVSERDSLIASLQEQVEKLTRERDDLQNRHDSLQFALDGIQAHASLAKLREGAEPFAFVSKEKLPDFDVNGTGIVSVLLFPKGTLRPENECPLYLHPTEQTDARSGVRVKALEWDGYDAASPVGGYRVQRLDNKWEPLRDGYYMLPRRHGVVEAFNTVDEAKAAAQADYERRIMSALSPAAPEGRELTEALQNLIQSANSVALEFVYSLPGGHQIWDDLKVARAALAEQEKGG